MELLAIMPEAEWRLIEGAAFLMSKEANWLRAEVLRKRAGYDVLDIARNERERGV